VINCRPSPRARKVKRGGEGGERREGKGKERKEDARSSGRPFYFASA